MSNGAKTLIRIPMLLLAAADLALLAMRLRPWDEISRLPGGGSVGYDPAICLVAYLGLVFWLTGANGSRLITAQTAITRWGLLAGAVLAAKFWMGGEPSAAQTSELQGALLITAAIVWGVAGIAAKRAVGSLAACFLSGIWCAMVSALIACAVVLGQFFVVGPPPETQDSYRQFQDIGIGSPGTVVLVHALTSATALLLVGPIAGGIAGLICGFFARPRKA